MAYQPTPLDTAGNALRYISSISLAAQVISTGSGLPDQEQIHETVYNLTAAAEWLARLGNEAINQVETDLT